MKQRAYIYGRQQILKLLWIEFVDYLRPGFTVHSVQMHSQFQIETGCNFYIKKKTKKTKSDRYCNKRQDFKVTYLIRADDKTACGCVGLEKEIKVCVANN